MKIKIKVEDTANYPGISNNLTPPGQIMYMTHAIENSYSQLRKVTKTKRAFSSDVAFDEVIGGFSAGSYKNDVWSSPDGKTWTEATGSAAFSARYNHSAVVFDDKMWVIGGFAAGSYKNDVWY